MRAQSQTGVPGLPDMNVSVRQVFGIDTDLEIPAYSIADEHVPDVDPDYLFNKEVTLAILAGCQAQPPRHDPGLSRHREIDPHRAGWPRGSTGRACASTSIVTSAVSISSAKTRSC